MVGAADAHREYKKFVEKNSIPKERQFEIMETFHVYKHLEFDMREFAVNHAVNKTKKFLSLNRLPKLHRNMLVGLLSHNGLLEHGYVSLGLQKEEYAEAIDYLKIVVPNANPNTYIGLEKIKDQLPLQVDNVDLRINQFGTNSLSGSFYETTCFSLVTSTFALESNEPSVGFTEKEIKPILYEHPFIIYNRPGVLQHLKNMGFMTFGRWFDESYDDEQDDVKRLDKIIAEVKRLSSISFDKWKDMHKEMLPILLHNKNWLIKYNTEHCFFTSDLKNFLHHVT
jgi:hypothetical protein